MFTSRRIVFVFFTCVSFMAAAQTIQVQKESARVKNESADGVQVQLQATYEEAESALQKWMKSVGKTKTVENYMVVAEPVIQGTAYATPLYGMVKQVGNVISVWTGIQKKEWNENDVEPVMKDLESLMHNFGVNFHRDKIQKQIDESLRAQQAVERQQQRLVNQNEDLNQKVDNNKQEKIDLERRIEVNKVELETLLKKLEKNKKDQDSVVVVLEQVKKAVEMHRDRQRKVN